MHGTGSSDAIKGLCEGIQTNVDILKEWHSDLSESVAHSFDDIKEKLASPTPTNEVMMAKVGVSVDKMNSQLATMKTLLVDTLTVYNCLSL